MKYSILALLDRRPMYGYELKAELMEEIGRHYEVNYGSLYRALDKLLRSGDVLCRVEAQDSRPDRKVYQITAAGRQHWLAWLLTPVAGGSVLHNDVFVKLILSFTSPIDPKAVLGRQRRADIELLQALTRLRDGADQELQVRWGLLVEAAILQVEARLKWLEHCDDRLEELRKADGIEVARTTLADLREKESAPAVRGAPARDRKAHEDA